MLSFYVIDLPLTILILLFYAVCLVDPELSFSVPVIFVFTGC